MSRFLDARQHKRKRVYVLLSLPFGSLEQEVEDVSDPAYGIPTDFLDKYQKGKAALAVLL